jgi:hypothetical protein
LIQQRIVIDLDSLIEQARQQQAQTRNSNASKKPGQSMPKPGENMAQAQNQGKKPGQKPGSKPGGTTPAGDERMPGEAPRQEDLSREIAERLAEWGQISPRVRDAVQGMADEKVLEEYSRLVDEYRRSLAEKGSNRQ